MFDVRHSNVNCQKDMNVKLFDDGHSNIEYENDQMSSINLFDV